MIPFDVRKGFSTGREGKELLGCVFQMRFDAWVSLTGLGEKNKENKPALLLGLRGGRLDEKKVAEETVQGTELAGQSSSLRGTAENHLS